MTGTQIHTPTLENNNTWTDALNTFNNNVIVGGTLGVTGLVTLTAGVNSPVYQVGGVSQIGTGPLVSQTSPTLITPILGVATATSVNKITLTQPATGATLTLINGTTITGPASSGTLALVGAIAFQKQIFTANGTFTIPANVSSVKATVVGGGGAGGGSTTGTAGGGGGAGGTGIKWLSALTPGNTIAVTIGGGGTGVSNGSGSNGSNSTIASGTQTITTVTGSGGVGGSNTKTPGTGGGSTNGDLNCVGGDGTFGLSGSQGGTGGSSILGGGARGAFAVGGNAAGLYGGGGGGSSDGTFAGGSGASGVVVFEWLT